MSSISHTIARRGFQAAHSAITKKADDNETIEISASAVLALSATALLFLCLLLSVGYTYGSLIPTLCMVEETETNAYVAINTIEGSGPPPYSETPDNGIKKPATETSEVESEILLVRSQPITSKLRTTILHLRARAGRWSRFRGFSLFIVWGIVRGFLVSAIASIPFLQSRAGMAFAVIAAETILARWSLTWIQIVISEPSTKKWYQRIPSIKSWPKIAPAVALQATAAQIVQGFPMLVCSSFGSMKHMHDSTFEPGHKDMYKMFGQSMMGIFLVLALFVLIEIPATVSLVRVAASMLPEEDEAIVPFDRTFGGKVVPSLIGGSGKIGMLEAWRSFPWASRKRLLKLIAKVFAMMISVWVLFSFTIIAEAHLLLGDKVGEVMKAVHGMGRH